LRREGPVQRATVIEEELGEPEASLRALAGSTLEEAIGATQRYLFSIQRADGHWCGELEGDTILESEYILALCFLGRLKEKQARKAAEYLRRQQMPDGGWAVYPGGPADVSASVKAYLALKLVGDTTAAPHMARARDVILGLGGVDASNSFTKIYLAIFGQYDWSKCPAVPPEIMLLPDWFPLNLYGMSSWSRAIVVPLSIIWARRPSCPVPDGFSIGEIVGATGPLPPKVRRSPKERVWRALFRRLDWTFKAVEGLSLTPFRRRALRKAERWILARLQQGDGLAAIFPPILNTIFALRCLGYPPEHPVLQAQVRELERLELEEKETLRLQPCFSAVWDTALALHALLESGIPEDDPRLLRGASWLLSKEVRHAGDWRRWNPKGEPSGWFFEYRNECYPDADDTTEVLAVLNKVRLARPLQGERPKEAITRGLAWLLAMQNDDGGWAAFDKGCDNELLTFIPFADHNAMIDPSCEDITGRALICLRELGLDPSHRAVRRAVAFLQRSQRPDGTWYGRWGCNYIYGTWLALWGLKSAGEDLTDRRYVPTVEWLRGRQNPDGGWGELPRSYDEPERKGEGPSTPSQTAWALMALFATGDTNSPSIRRGIDYLLARQQDDGSWDDEYWTGTGFPKVFYLRYHLYATYFPLWSLSLFVDRGETADQGIS